MSAPNYNYKSPNYNEFEEFRNRNSKWRGIWITNREKVLDERNFRIDIRTSYECSICGSKFYEGGLFPTKFCPECGADMREQ